MKLFWNSQNDNKSFWGEYHYKNSKKWIFDILSEIKFTEVKGLNEVNYIEPLIIVDSEVQKKGNFYNDFFKKYKNIHLGDEGGKVDKSFYLSFKQVFRTFHLNSFSKIKNVTSIPIGYKTGPITSDIEINNRKYNWNFLGTIHGASRYDLIFQNRNIEPHYVNITKKFGGQNSLSAAEYYKIMANTKDKYFRIRLHSYN